MACVLSAAVSTLLDLGFRVEAAHHFNNQRSLLHFFGYEGNASPLRSVKLGEAVVPLRPDGSGVSNIDLFIDGSIIEVLVDTRQQDAMHNLLL
jgi:hypothetical protein